MAECAPSAAGGRARRGSPGWCSLRFRFDREEIDLLRGAELVHGAHLAHRARPDALRAAMTLARAGHKLAQAIPGVSVSLADGETHALLEALRFAAGEVRWLSEPPADAESRAASERRQVIERAFPVLAASRWRSFGLSRSLDSLARRLELALRGEQLA